MGEDRSTRPAIGDHGPDARAASAARTGEDIVGEHSREQGGPRAGATWGMLSAMNTSEFRRHADAVVDWMADYLDQVEAYPVRAQVKPGEIAARLPASPPERGESMDRIFADFQSVLLPGSRTGSSASSRYGSREVRWGANEIRHPQFLLAVRFRSSRNV